MRVRINGKIVEEAGERMTVSQLLEFFDVRPEYVAVAVNGTIVDRRDWAAIMIREADEIDVVHIVGGGSGEKQAVGAAMAVPHHDVLVIAGRRFRSRLMVGTGKYPSSEVMKAALEASGAEIVTVSVRHMNLDGGENGIMEHLNLSRYSLLPNTAGATTVEQAVRMARLARAATGTNWIKLEVIGDLTTLWPDTAATVEATRVLVKEGFVVLPYTSSDVVTALRLEEAGAATVMPLASLIGSGQGVIDWQGIQRIIERISVPVVVDAGLGSPADAALAMELGADACLVNTAVAKAKNPVLMAEAMKWGVISGRQGYLAGRIPRQETAAASSPMTGDS